MKIKFPRNITIDLDNIPQNFEDLIRESFEAYTSDTAKDYTYQDKLAYIDVCRKHLHRAEMDLLARAIKVVINYEC